MDTLVVNFAAGPGTGKSTTAASIFARLKRVGVNCELALEFAKEKVWEKNAKIFEDQLYIFGKQHWKLHRLQGEVDVVLTDSPLFLSCVYNKQFGHLDKIVLEAFNSFSNLNIFLERTKEYQPKGRLQTLEEAKSIDVSIKDFMQEADINFECYHTTESDELRIAEKILTLICREDLIPKLYDTPLQRVDTKVLDHFMLLLLESYIPAKKLSDAIEIALDRSLYEPKDSDLLPYAKNLTERILGK